MLQFTIYGYLTNNAGVRCLDALEQKIVPPPSNILSGGA